MAGCVPVGIYDVGLCCANLGLSQQTWNLSLWLHIFRMRISFQWERQLLRCGAFVQERIQMAVCGMADQNLIIYSKTLVMFIELEGQVDGPVILG